jgi:hypothetical protein
MTRLSPIASDGSSQPFVLATPVEAHAADPTAEELSTILAATQQFFPGEVTIATEWDPEQPIETYTVLHVRAQGAVRSIVERRCQWVKAIADIAPRLRGKVRLSIDPRP